MTTTPHVEVYTDGGCKPNPGPGGWGVVLRAESGHIRELSGYEEDTTNNRMELTAAVKALRALNRPCRVTFFTDSHYVQKGITDWLPAWVKRGWQRKGNQPVLNEDLWRALHAETLRHDIDWQWVKGHAGNTYNERADQLATTVREKLTGAAEFVAKSAEDAPAVEIALRIAVAGSGQAGGWVLRIASTGDAESVQIVTGHETDITANRLELLAALNAARHAPPGQRVVVWCPSDYLLQGMTRWVRNWQAGGWKTRDGTPVKHRDVWQALAEESAVQDIEWAPEPEPQPDYIRELKKLAQQVAEEP